MVRVIVIPATAGIQEPESFAVALLGWTAPLRHRMCQAVKMKQGSQVEPSE